MSRHWSVVGCVFGLLLIGCRMDSGFFAERDSSPITNASSADAEDAIKFSSSPRCSTITLDAQKHVWGEASTEHAVVRTLTPGRYSLSPDWENPGGWSNWDKDILPSDSTQGTWTWTAVVELRAPEDTLQINLDPWMNWWRWNSAEQITGEVLRQEIEAHDPDDFWMGTGAGKPELEGTYFFELTKPADAILYIRDAIDQPEHLLDNRGAVNVKLCFEPR